MALRAQVLHPCVSQLPASQPVMEKPAARTVVVVSAERVRSRRYVRPVSVFSANLSAADSSVETMAAVVLAASAEPAKYAKAVAVCLTGLQPVLQILVKMVVSAPKMPPVFLSVRAQTILLVTTVRPPSLFKTVTSTWTESAMASAKIA